MVRSDIRHPSSQIRIPNSFLSLLVFVLLHPASNLPLQRCYRLIPTSSIHTGQGRRWASLVAPSSQAIPPSVSMFAPSLTRLKSPAAPRSMNVATGIFSPPLSSLNPNCIAPKPVHMFSLKAPRASMASWQGPRNSSGRVRLRCPRYQQRRHSISPVGLLRREIWSSARIRRRV